jgi:hypothetical protein
MKMVMVEGELLGSMEEGELIGTYSQKPFYVVREVMTGNIVKVPAIERRGAGGSDIFFFHPERQSVKLFPE